MKNDKIIALDDRQKAREKLPVFYGSRDNFTHGFREALNNGVDEVLNNFENGIIEVELFDDLETIAIKDNGRGIPIQEVDDNGKPYYELIFTTLFAGGKYEVSDNSNSGVNGVGVSTLNFSSSIFNVEVANHGYIYKIEYENGGYVKTPLTKVSKSEDHYTKLTFKLDKEVYTSTTYSYDYIRDIVNKTAKVSPNITLKLIYQNNEEIFNYTTILEYFDKHTIDNFTNPYLGDNKLYEESDGEKTQVQLVFASTNSDDNKLQECMLNGNNLIEKSSIYEGVINGFKLVCHKYSKDNGLYQKGEKNITLEDIDASINFCCNVLSNRIEFANQTKFSTFKKLYKEVSQKYTQELLEIYSIENKLEFTKLINNVLMSKRIREKSEKTRLDIRKKLSEPIDTINNRVDGLVDCEIHGEGAELYITEGLSALGGCILSRNPVNQAGMPIRGKILNCLKAPYSKIFASEIITNLIKVIGCGIECDKKNKELGQFDISKLRFGKIIFLVDEDADAKSICCLLLTMFYRLMPQLLNSGRIYIAQTPLFEIKDLDTDEVKYANSEKERDNILKGIKRSYVGRNKGIGELEFDILSATAMNPETRSLLQVVINDEEEMVHMFDKWMNDSVTERKEHIENNLDKYVNSAE